MSVHDCNLPQQSEAKVIVIGKLVHVNSLHVGVAIVVSQKQSSNLLFFLQASCVVATLQVPLVTQPPPLLVIQFYPGAKVSQAVFDVVLVGATEQSSKTQALVSLFQ